MKLNDDRTTHKIKTAECKVKAAFCNPSLPLHCIAKKKKTTTHCVLFASIFVPCSFFFIKTCMLRVQPGTCEIFQFQTEWNSAFQRAVSFAIGIFVIALN